jgi:hypothetical protein
MFESTGKVIEVQKFSDAEDQITIEIKVPEPLGEEGETRSHDWIVSHRNRESGGCCKNRDQSALTPSDVDRLIGQMGHTDPATFSRHYYAGVPRAQTKKFWAICPKKLKPDNVIQFKRPRAA